MNKTSGQLPLELIDTVSFEECCNAHFLGERKQACRDCSDAQLKRCWKEGDEWLKRRKDA